MAHSHTAVVVPTAVDSVKLDIGLSHRVAAVLLRLHPRKDPEQVVHDLLDQLKVEKLSREARGLNHWSEHAPKFLSGIIRKARREKKARYEKAETFFRTNHSEAFAFACAALKDRDEAEEIVAQTYVEFLEGKTTEEHFFRALKLNILNRQQRMAYEKTLLETTVETFESREASGEDGEGDERTWDPISARTEDQDPLDILIARQDSKAKKRQIRKAMKIAQTDWRYCWIGQKQWGRELGISTTRMGKP